MKVKVRLIAKPIGIENVLITVDSEQTQSINLEGVWISISPNAYNFTLEQSLDIDDRQLDDLNNPDKYYEVGNYAYGLCENLFDKQKTVLKYLKYFYGIPELDEYFSFKGVPEWSQDGTNWKPIEMKHRAKWVPTSPIYHLPEPLIDWLPILIDRGIEPLFAFIHLSKAFNEKDTRHQWIHATIAAELAFKEFLSKYDKKLTSLILKVPSPPLKTLYGDVLFDQTGERSPYLSALHKGTETRNTLIHQPLDSSPEKYDTEVYLLTVQSAILHLQYLLNKEVAVLEYFFKLSVDKLDKRLSESTSKQFKAKTETKGA